MCAPGDVGLEVGRDLHEPHEPVPEEGPRVARAVGQQAQEEGLERCMTTWAPGDMMCVIKLW